MDIFLPQSFGGGNLCRDNSFGIARTASVDAGGIFGGGNEGRNGVHVGGENDRRPRLFWPGGEHIAARAFDRNFLRLKSPPFELKVKQVTDRCLRYR